MCVSVRMHKMYILMCTPCETIERMNLGQAAKQPRITVFKGRIVAICRHNRNINLQYTALTATQIVASNNNYLLSVRGERHLPLLWTCFEKYKCLDLLIYKKKKNRRKKQMIAYFIIFLFIYCYLELVSMILCEKINWKLHRIQFF